MKNIYWIIYKAAKYLSMPFSFLCYVMQFIGVISAFPFAYISDAIVKVERKFMVKHILASQEKK